MLSTGLPVKAEFLEHTESKQSLAQVSVETAPVLNSEYTTSTKKILLTGIELERFSLNYRLESAKQPKLRQLRYFLAQEAGSAGGLAFEVTGDAQFGKGRKSPLKISQSALRGALATTMSTSIIAGASSGLELTSNLVRAYKNEKNGYDSRSATKFVTAHLKVIDDLLAERQAIVERSHSNPGYERAVAEGHILRSLRSSFVNEYATFNADTRSYLLYQDLFYFLNASYNTVGAVAADVAYRAVSRPHLNGTANILFTTTGAMAMMTPIITNAVGKHVKSSTFKATTKELQVTKFDPDAFAAECKTMDALGHSNEGTMMPTFPVTNRMAIYTASNTLFEKQLEGETKLMRRFEKVALQTSVLGPLIGATLMTQGILGTNGYYKYPVQPRRQLAQYYYGSVVGTVGTGAATVANAVSFLQTVSYEHKLSKENMLPRQLIQKRLQHLAEIEKTVAAL
jgi:hypothetical protein